MNTSFQSVTERAAKTALADTSRRATITKADAEKEARFHDVLSDRTTREAAADSTSDTQTRVKAMRALTEDTAKATDAVNPTMQAISVQQAILNAPATADSRAKKSDADPASSDDSVAVDVAPERMQGGAVKDPAIQSGISPIEPHGPPVLVDDDDGSMLTGGIKAPPIEPHGPPGTTVEDGPGRVKPGPIRPHGPVEPTPPERMQEKHPPIEDTGVEPVNGHDRGQVPGVTNPPSADAATKLKQPPITVDPSPTDKMSPDRRVSPGGGTASGGPFAAIPVAGRTSTEVLLATSPLSGEPAANDFRFTTVAQARLAANIAAEVPVKPEDPKQQVVSVVSPANLAASSAAISAEDKGKTVEDSLQITDIKVLTSKKIVNGTPAAKTQESVTTTLSNRSTATERDTPSSPDADALAVSGSRGGWSDDSLTGRAKDGDAARAFVAAALTPDAHAATTPLPFNEAASTTPASGIVRVDKMETLLETVQQTAQRIQFDGTGRMELRMHLEGVAEDVTVRVHLDENKQPQVSFQTGSPELRAALEQGWSDLKATVFTPAPDLRAALPMVTAGSSDSYADGQQIPAATNSVIQESATRWSGYA